ncbi:hypothetical protein PR048_031188, partial [Dryococelus australis]
MRMIEMSMEQRRNEKVGGNGRSPRKPADQRHRPARFPTFENPGETRADFRSVGFLLIVVRVALPRVTAAPFYSATREKHHLLSDSRKSTPREQAYAIPTGVSVATRWHTRCRSRRGSVDSVIADSRGCNQRPFSFQRGGLFQPDPELWDLAGEGRGGPQMKRRGGPTRARRAYGFRSWQASVAPERASRDRRPITEHPRIQKWNSHVYNAPETPASLDIPGSRLSISALYRRNVRVWEMEASRENPLTSGIVRHDSHMQCANPGVTRPGIESGSPWWEASKLTAQPPRPLTLFKEEGELASETMKEQSGRGGEEARATTDINETVYFSSSEQKKKRIPTFFHYTRALIHHLVIRLLEALKVKRFGSRHVTAMGVVLNRDLPEQVTVLQFTTVDGFMPTSCAAADDAQSACGYEWIFDSAVSSTATTRPPFRLIGFDCQWRRGIVPDDARWSAGFLDSYALEFQRCSILTPPHHRRLLRPR